MLQGVKASPEAVEGSGMDLAVPPVKVASNAAPVGRGREAADIATGVMDAIPWMEMTSAEAAPAVPKAGCLAEVEAPVGRGREAAETGWVKAIPLGHVGRTQRAVVKGVIVADPVITEVSLI